MNSNRVVLSANHAPGQWDCVLECGHAIELRHPPLPEGDYPCEECHEAARKRLQEACAAFIARRV